MADVYGSGSEPSRVQPSRKQVARSSYRTPTDAPVLVATPSPRPAQVTLHSAATSPPTVDDMPAIGNGRRLSMDENDNDFASTAEAQRIRQDSASLSLELLLVALEEENERLRSMIASERRARLHAEAEWASEAARARDLEQQACEMSSLLEESQRRLAELQHEASTRTFVQTWMDSAAAAQLQEGDSDTADATGVPGIQTPEPPRGSVQAAATDTAGQLAPSLADDIKPVCATAAIRISSRGAAHRQPGDPYSSLGGQAGNCKEAKAAALSQDTDDASLGTCLHASELELDFDGDSEASGLDTSGLCCAHPELLPSYNTVTTSGDGTATSPGCSFPPRSTHIATPFLPLAHGCGRGRLRSDGGAGSPVPACGAWAPTVSPPALLQRAHTMGLPLACADSCEGLGWGLREARSNPQQHGELVQQVPLLLSTPPSSKVLGGRQDPASVLPPSTPWQPAAAIAFPTPGCPVPTPYGGLQGSPSSLPRIHIRAVRSSSMKAPAPALTAAGMFATGSFCTASLRRIHVDQPAWEDATAVAAAPYDAATDKGPWVGVDLSAGAAAATSFQACGSCEGAAIGGQPDVGSEWCNIPLGSPMCTPMKAGTQA